MPAKPKILAWLSGLRHQLSAQPGYTAPVSLFKSASLVSLLTLASRVAGLVRDLLIASTFGASALTDAFNVQLDREDWFILYQAALGHEVP